MIRTDREHQMALERLAAERDRFGLHRKALVEQGLNEDEIKRVMDPVMSFHLQLAEEVESYERLKRGELGEKLELRNLGHFLVTLRIARGLSQRELAARLEVHESQVSRDERNEYRGITLERATRILDAMNVRLQTQIESFSDERGDHPLILPDHKAEGGMVARQDC